MKPYLRYRVVLGLALLLAGAVGCKLGGSANKTSDKTDSTTNTNSATNTTSTTSSNATNTSPTTAHPDIAGKYNIVGTNPGGGGSYKGKLEIIAHGDVYQFRWNAGTQYDGVGVANGN